MVLGGHFVFSAEHPIYMAPTKPGWSVDADGRKTWPIDRYLVEGPRTTDWLARGVVKQLFKFKTSNFEHGLFIFIEFNEFGPDNCGADFRNVFVHLPLQTGARSKLEATTPLLDKARGEYEGLTKATTDALLNLQGITALQDGPTKTVQTYTPLLDKARSEYEDLTKRNRESRQLPNQ